MHKSLDLTITIDPEMITDYGAEFRLTVHEPESGVTTSGTFPVSVDEHPEFDDAIGNEIYSWIALMLDEMGVNGF